MATMTLLEITQNILGAMESDKVNSIGDTEESLSVAEVVKETYFDLIAQRDWPFLKMRGNLTGLSDTDNPTKMQFPATCNKVYWLKYNKKDVSWMEPKQFQDLIDARVVTANVYDANGYGLASDPSYWTSFDDDYVWFDSRDEDEDDTLQESKAVAYLLTTPTWSVEDTFIPQLPEKMFPYLLADAKATCFVNFKQTANAKEDRKSQRLRVRMQNEAWKNEKGESMYDSNVNYGRSTPSPSRLRVGNT